MNAEGWPPTAKALLKGQLYFIGDGQAGNQVHRHCESSKKWSLTPCRFFAAADCCFSFWFIEVEWLISAGLQILSRTVFSFLIFGIIEQKQAFWLVDEPQKVFISVSTVYSYFVKSKYTFSFLIHCIHTICVYKYTNKSTSTI